MTSSKSFSIQLSIDNRESCIHTYPSTANGNVYTFIILVAIKCLTKSQCLFQSNFGHFSLLLKQWMMHTGNMCDTLTTKVKICTQTI